MAAGDVYNISGGLFPARPALKMLGGAVDDGVQIDALVAAAVLANHTHGTITAWIMVPDVTGQYAVFGSGDADAVEYFYFGVNAGYLECKAAVAGPDVNFDLTATTTQLTPYKWHHIAFVQDGVRPQMYVDGVIQVCTETDVTESAYWYADWANMDGGHWGCADSIAGGALLTLEFKGLIGTCKIWSAAAATGALSQDQIVDDMKGVSNTTSLFGHYTWTDTTLYTDVTGTYNGIKVGDFTRVNQGNEFVARLQYEPAAPVVVADGIAISISDNRADAVLVKAA